MSNILFGKTNEEVITIKEFPLKKAQSILKKETVAILGYGSQGQAQALNLRDNAVTTLVGQRKVSPRWALAQKDGWKPGETLFSLEKAAQKATIILYLLSDAGQKAFWPDLLPYLTKGKMLVFAHGFSIVFQKHTGVVPPENIDCVVVAPKGSGLTLRRNFLQKGGLASGVAVYQNFSGHALQKARALAIAIGSPTLYTCDVKREVYGDLVGERGVLVGALAGIMEAQYAVLRKHGHTPSEAFNDTVEELTQGLVGLVGEHGMDWLLANISTTAQRGALDWKGEFKKATLPVFEKLYKRVESGKEAQIVLLKNGKKNYRNLLDKELKKLARSELWQTGKIVRQLRPKQGE